MSVVERERNEGPKIIEFKGVSLSSRSMTELIKLSGFTVGGNARYIYDLLVTESRDLFTLTLVSFDKKMTDRQVENWRAGNRPGCKFANVEHLLQLGASFAEKLQEEDVVFINALGARIKSDVRPNFYDQSRPLSELPFLQLDNGHSATGVSILDAEPSNKHGAGHHFLLVCE